jgi:hypothetical protein
MRAGQAALCLRYVLLPASGLHRQDSLEVLGCPQERDQFQLPTRAFAGQAKARQEGSDSLRWRYCSPSSSAGVIRKVTSLASETEGSSVTS